MKLLSVKKLIPLLQKTQGNLAACARAVGCSRFAVHQYVHRHPELKQLMIDSRNALVDDAETALGMAVAKGEGWAVCFTLKCLGKDRGYVERVDHWHSGDGGGPIPILRIIAPTAELPQLLPSFLPERQALNGSINGTGPEPGTNGAGDEKLS